MKMPHSYKFNFSLSSNNLIDENSRNYKENVDEMHST